MSVYDIGFGRDREVKCHTWIDDCLYDRLSYRVSLLDIGLTWDPLLLLFFEILVL